jgi:CRISPR-associated endoribonuclease Cas2 subtype I-E
VLVMIMEKVPACLRSTLSLWLTEPKEGVFVGNATKQVRDEIWAKAVELTNISEAIIQVWFDLETNKFHYRQNGIRNSGNINLGQAISFTH